jgi:hypothetical protein
MRAARERRKSAPNSNSAGSDSSMPLSPADTGHHHHHHHQQSFYRYDWFRRYYYYYYYYS